MTVAEVALGVLAFYLLPVYRVFPDDFAGEPPPQAMAGTARSRILSARRFGNTTRTCRAHRRRSLGALVTCGACLAVKRGSRANCKTMTVFLSDSMISWAARRRSASTYCRKV
jgi:hypothetical protein